MVNKFIFKSLVRTITVIRRMMCARKLFYEIFRHNTYNTRPYFTLKVFQLTKVTQNRYGLDQKAINKLMEKFLTYSKKNSLTVESRDFELSRFQVFSFCDKFSLDKKLSIEKGYKYVSSYMEIGAVSVHVHL